MSDITNGDAMTAELSGIPYENNDEQAAHERVRELLERNPLLGLTGLMDVVARERAAESILQLKRSDKTFLFELSGQPELDAKDEADWTERALCAETDPEAFFPEKGGSTREAKKVCMKYDVREKCLMYALDHDERFGIWGGLSERERRRLKKSLI